MSTIQEKIAQARSNTSTSDLTKIDSLNNAFKITVLSDSLREGTAIDSSNIPPEVFDQAAENVNNYYTSEKGGRGHQFTEEEYEIFGKPTDPTGTLPSKPYVSKSWSFSESDVGEELTGGKEGTTWFLNPHVSFREWYSDVGRGTGEPFTILGQPVMGLGESSVIYDPSGEPGEEKYNKKYVDELIRRMALLESPQERIATGEIGMQEGEGRLLTKIRDENRGFGYEGIFPEEMSWKSNPELRGSFLDLGKAGQRYGSAPEVVGPYVESPEYQSILFAEKSKYYHDALNALERMPGDLPSAKRLSEFIGRDEWSVFDPERESEGEKYELYGGQMSPISEDIANLKGWARNPFEDVNSALDAIKEYASTSDDTSTVDISGGVPSAWFDPATEPFDSSLVEDLF
jgi:hypothetical protein